MDPDAVKKAQEENDKKEAEKRKKLAKEKLINEDGTLSAFGIN
jgi:hypothetical protein